MINDKMELISVIIPTYNRAKYVNKAVKSVLNQTYKNIEVIVVIDSSPDNTFEVLSKIEDNRLVVIELKENRGANFARNYGVEISKGYFVAFLDDDDIWDQRKLEIQREAFDSDAVGIVYTAKEINYPEFNISYNVKATLSGDMSTKILVNNFVGSTSSVMVKKEVFAESGGFDVELKARQDYDLWIRICQLTKIKGINKPLVKYYNYTNTNQISDDVYKAIEATTYISSKYKNLIDSLSRDEKMTLEQNNYNNFGTRFLRNNDKINAFKMFMRSFAIKPTFNGLLQILSTPIKYKYLLLLRSKI